MSHTSAYATIIEQVLALFPKHRRFLEKARPQTAALRTAEILANDVLRLAGDNLPRYVEGYRWMCAMMLDEELHFRRYGTYRLTSFAEANANVYQNSEIMGRYMDGLLLSQVLWPNHVKVFDFYLHRFLGKITQGRHLEIGPGHGLFLHHAATLLNGSIEGWDISLSALQHTAECLDRLGAGKPVSLEVRDLLTIELRQGERFHSIVLSEVLEHLEDPHTALQRVATLLTPDGQIFVNVPVNSPSIDHISLFRAPEEVCNLIERAGLRIRETCVAPAAGYTEIQARRAQTTISCAIVASPA